jgi:hypothetical protein
VREVSARTKLKTAVVLGICFGVFSILAVVMFSFIFMKMGAIPKWREPYRMIAPVLLSPAPGADLAKAFEMRWRAVPGAARYRVHVWQMYDGDETTLIDEEIESTSIKVEPVHESKVQWEVQAIDARGVAGPMMTGNVAN